MDEVVRSALRSLVVNVPTAMLGEIKAVSDLSDAQLALISSVYGDPTPAQFIEKRKLSLLKALAACERVSGTAQTLAHREQLERLVKNARYETTTQSPAAHAPRTAGQSGTMN